MPRNVAAFATAPHPTRREIAPLTAEQARRRLEAAKGDRLEALYVLALTTGMRQGERPGFQWRDIDLDGGTLRVNRTIYEGVVSPPKTDAGRRAIRLSESAVLALKNHKRNAATQSGRISGGCSLPLPGRP